MTRLTRSSARINAAAPVRAVHLGLGGFHRAHQAWYTAADPDWGIAAYTFRNTELPRRLNEQDGLFCTLVRGGTSDSAEIISSISRAHPGTDHDQWLTDLAAPAVAVLTLTVTEAAYRVPDAGEDSALARLVAGLRARFRANASPITIVPCDNVPDNGGVLRRLLRTAVEREHPSLREWVEHDVAVASTVVDRITPAATAQDQSTVAELTGLRDLAPVATETFTEWLLAGTFPGGRPKWERAGARFVNDLEVYERRKLWFLNGAHTLLAYVGLARGFDTVREAIADDALGELVESWWDTASIHTALPEEELADYRERLRQRFSSLRIRHPLAQIAANGSQKIPARLLPVLHAEREQARLPSTVVHGLAAWLHHLRHGEVQDARSADLVPLARSADPVQRVLAEIDPQCGEDAELVTAVHAESARFPVPPGTTP